MADAQVRQERGEERCSHSSRSPELIIRHVHPVSEPEHRQPDGLASIENFRQPYRLITFNAEKASRSLCKATDLFSLLELKRNLGSASET